MTSPVPKSLSEAREARAVTLRVAGLTLDQIAEAVGYSHKGTASKAITRALAKERSESVDQLRQIHHARIEALLRAVMGPALNGDLQAVETARRLLAESARLHGLNAPDRVVVSDAAREELDALVTELETMLRAAT